jgi:tetratricopeptide (TPR) repeat protein
VLGAAGAGGTLGDGSDEAPLRKLLDQAAAAISEELTDRPLMQANLHFRLWNAYRNGGFYADALQMAQATLAIRKRVLPEGSVDVGHAAHSVGLAYYDLGDYEPAERMLREALTAFGAVPDAAASAEDPVPERAWGRSTVLHLLGEVLSLQGRHAEAVPLYAEALEIRRALRGEAHWSYGSTLLQLTQAHLALQDHAAIAVRQREAQRLLELSRTLPGTDPHRSGAPLLVGTLAMEQGDPGAAEPFLREAATIRAGVLGEDAYLTAYAESVLGMCLFRLGHVEHAEELLERSTRNIRANYSPGNVRVVETVRRAIEFHERTGRPEKAEDYRALLPAAVNVPP